MSKYSRINNKLDTFPTLISFIYCRTRNSEIRIRRYDILSAKQLVPDHIDSEDSDDELFNAVQRNDSTRHLIPVNIPVSIPS